jgi:Fe-S-cluster formation regulator IscX/YfhJ
LRWKFLGPGFDDSQKKFDSKILKIRLKNWFTLAYSQIIKKNQFLMWKVWNFIWNVYWNFALKCLGPGFDDSQKKPGSKILKIRLKNWCGIY